MIAAKRKPWSIRNGIEATFPGSDALVCTEFLFIGVFPDESARLITFADVCEVSE
jgi:hypothetical protein